MDHAKASLGPRSPWIVPIPSTGKLARMTENLSAVDLLLSPDDLTEIESGTGGFAVQGKRLPEPRLKMARL
jgi:diketogulonate reductase-like aldo/keto reductase